MPRISVLVESLLDSQEGFCFMVSVSQSVIQSDS